MLRLGQIDYINALPIFLGITSGEVTCDAELVRDVPTQLNRRLHAGELDLSFVSSMEYLIHSEQYRPLLPLGIAACGEVQSVILHVRGELAHLNGREVALSSQSATSAQLVKILCHHLWHVEPTYVELPSLDLHADYDAFLLIGDEALLSPEFKGYHSIDVAEAWYQLTGLPIVFALLVARREVVDEREWEVTELQRQLRDSLVWGRSHPRELLSAAQEQLHLSAAQLTHYFSLLRYELRERELEGLDRYAELSGFVGVAV